MDHWVRHRDGDGILIAEKQLFVLRRNDLACHIHKIKGRLSRSAYSDNPWYEFANIVEDQSSGSNFLSQH